jgi:hypothetical protein
MDDRADAATLIEVGSAAEDQCPSVGVPDRDRSHDARVSGYSRFGEARDVRIVNGGNRSADQVTGLPPTRTEHQCHVMV